MSRPALFHSICAPHTYFGGPVLVGRLSVLSARFGVRHVSHRLVVCMRAGLVRVYGQVTGMRGMYTATGVEHARNASKRAVAERRVR